MLMLVIVALLLLVLTPAQVLGKLLSTLKAISGYQFVQVFY